MISYELAKKLKDAGYPQEFNPKYDTGGGGAPGWDVRAPGFPELMEVLEEYIWTMRKGIFEGKKGWLVGQDTDASINPVDWKIFAFGETLEQAVVELYIKTKNNL